MAEPNSGCWLWNASVNQKGYGQFGWSTGKSRLAHRAAWEIHFGPVPDGLCVLHKCDVPSCVNPNHLFLGTNADNKADCVAKGRQAFLRGEMNPRAKLSEQNVRDIRVSNETATALAARYGLSIAAIAMARRGKNWRHI